MHREVLTHSAAEVAPLTAVELTKTKSPTAASSTRSRATADTDRYAAPDFTPFQMTPLLRIKDVCRLLRISKPNFWRLRERADFPQPTPVSDRVIGRRHDGITAWLDRRRRTPRH